MLLSHAEIAARIPHQGTMCLLERIEFWDADCLRAVAASHRNPDNPLRSHGRLASSCGIEYAAQAMAMHGALTAKHEERVRMGYLASVRGAILHVGQLDEVEGELSIEIARFSGDGNNVLYDFTVSGDGRVLVEGRAAVVINAGPLVA